MVPDLIKNDILWPKILERFDFPKNIGMEIVNRKTLMIMGLSFISWKGTLNRMYVERYNA